MNMTAVILAGGLGTRLSGTCQKCMTLINGKPFLDYLVEKLIIHHNRIIFALGFKSEEVIDFFNISSKSSPFEYYICKDGQLEAINKFYETKAHNSEDLTIFYNGDTLLPRWPYDPQSPLSGYRTLFTRIARGIYQSVGVYSPYCAAPFETIEDLISGSELSFYTGSVLQLNTPESLEIAKEYLSAKETFDAG